MCRRRIICMVLVVLAFIMPLSSAIMGYDIVARAGSTTWELHRTTSNINFTVDGNISGSGNFSRLTHIRELAGFDADESASSLNGSVQYNEKMRYISREGPVIITANLEEYRYEEPNTIENPYPDQPKILVSTSGEIEVDEHWPAYLGSYKQLRYSGDGIRTRERFNNNGDVSAESFYSWKLEKESLYKASLNRTLINAKITDEGIVEERRRNSTSSYAIRSESTGPSINLEFSKKRFFGAPTRFGRPENDIFVSEDFAGHQILNLKVDTSNYVQKPKDDLTEYWLDCCSGGYITMPPSYRMGSQGFGSDVASVFNCTCYKSLTKAI